MAAMASKAPREWLPKADAAIMTMQKVMAVLAHLACICICKKRISGMTMTMASATSLLPLM